MSRVSCVLMYLLVGSNTIVSIVISKIIFEGEGDLATGFLHYAIENDCQIVKQKTIDYITSAQIKSAQLVRSLRPFSQNLVLASQLYPQYRI